MDGNYSWLVGVKKTVYVFVGVASTAIAAMQGAGKLEGPDDLTWPVLFAGALAAVKWVSNYLKTTKTAPGSVANKLLPVLVACVAIGLGGCVSQRMMDATFHENGTLEAKTEYRATSFNVMGKIDSTAHTFGGAWTGDGVTITSGQNAEGFDMTNQAVIVDMIAEVVARGIELYIESLAAGVVGGPSEVTNLSIPLVSPLGP